MMTTIPKNRELPSKEAAVFKSILKFYEHKQYKKGLKGADQILKKAPDHGETLAMKGLFCHCLDRKEEGHEYIKKGIRQDIRSHICWHVYGLVHRAEKNYEEASKCYAQALRCEPENIQILRDFSQLQIQMRNYEAFNESRHKLLSVRPEAKMHWFGLAVSYHLLKKYDEAEKILLAYVDGATEEATPYAAYEKSELLMYHNMIIEESGNFSRALAHLDTIRPNVLDKKNWAESKARLLLKSQQYALAEVEYAKLLSNNADSEPYLQGLLASKQLDGPLDDTKRERILRALKDVATKNPRSHAANMMALRYAQGQEFETILNVFLTKSFQKGIPSLFKNLREIMADPVKAKVIEDTVLSYSAELDKSSTLDGESDVEPPTTKLWVLYFLAYLYDFKKDYQQALTIIDQAIEHSPTVVELLMLKAKIYKHCGDVESAMNTINEGRLLDLQDRYINSKCSKYMLANDQMKMAEDTVALFTKSNNPDPVQDLTDMQCLWYAAAAGKSFARQRLYGQALKKFHLIESHFSNFYDDQFDFHGYALRKVTLRAYVDLIRAHDTLRGHKYFVKTAKAAVQLYIDLFDKPPSLNPEGVDTSNMTEQEIKKALKKQKKAEAKTQLAATQTPQDPKKKVDDDPLGKKYLENADFLGEASKFLKHLHHCVPNDIEGWLLACEVNLRKEKLLLVLKAIHQAEAIDPAEPKVHLYKLRFCLAVEQYRQQENKNSTVLQVLEDAKKQFTAGRSLQTLNQAFGKDFPGAKYQIVFAQAKLLLNEPVEKAVAVLKSLPSEILLEEAIEAHKLLKNWKQKEAAEQVGEKYRLAFPLASYFK
ncbi:NMDA receptor-regulated protein 1-domain-containing protein [Gorgonomyces haynaldii]|nr:NMDA receptor-regulated protein 1-domain-containing protein [Gorgonomyces haynaldii]